MNQGYFHWWNSKIMAIISIDYLRKTMNQLTTKKGKENIKGNPQVLSSSPNFFPFFSLLSSHNTSSFLSSFISQQSLFPLRKSPFFSSKNRPPKNQHLALFFLSFLVFFFLFFGSLFIQSQPKKRSSLWLYVMDFISIRGMGERLHLDRRHGCMQADGMGACVRIGL